MAIDSNRRALGRALGFLAVVVFFLPAYTQAQETTVWSSTLTVRTAPGYSGSTVGYDPPNGALSSDDDFTLDGVAYTVTGIYENDDGEEVDPTYTLTLTLASDNDRDLPDAVEENMTLHVGSTSLALSGAIRYWFAKGYTITDTVYAWTMRPSSMGWSEGDEVAVSLKVASTMDQGTVEDLTASFSDMPASHDGASTFNFRVAFSEDIGISHTTMRDDSFEVTGGDVTSARRVDGRHDLWELTVEPDSRDQVTITLAGGRACGTTGAVCTRGADPRPLSVSLSALVGGPPPEVSVADASAAEGSEVEFTVSLSPASSRQVTVDYETSSGTAESGTDFTAASGTLTFAANETSKTVSVATTDDSTDEADESFTLTLSGPANATLDDSSATGTITDNDDPPSLSVSGAGATEGGTIEFTVMLSEASDKQVTVDYETSGDTATSGTDFTAASGTLTFGAGETSKSVNVATTDDSDDEQNETFTLTLSNPVNATVSDSTATGTITDNDEPPPPDLTASFTGMPASHDAMNSFTFQVQFSENVGISFLTLRDDSFTVTGGDITGARRVDGRHDLWEMRVQPTTTDAISITLPGGRHCGTTGAVCTRTSDNRRPLSNSPSATVAGSTTSVTVVPALPAVALAILAALLYSGARRRL